MSYIEADNKNFDKLKRKLIKNKKIFQLVYSSVYPEVYSFVEKRGVDMRNNFHLKFKEWKDRKKYSQKSTEGYFSKAQNSPPPAGALQEKLVSNKDFEEEKKLRKNKNKREWKKKKEKECRREITAKNKELKQIKKAEKDKWDEKEIRARLKELNNNFTKMKEKKKTDKKEKLYFP